MRSILTFQVFSMKNIIEKIMKELNKKYIYIYIL